MLFTGLNLGAPITGFQFSQTGATDLDASDATFTDKSLSINLQGISIGIDAGRLITLVTGGVPRPGMIVLFTTGLCGIAGISRIHR